MIDHTPYTIKNGPNAGKILVNTRKFFACKKETFKYLEKIATKRGGLAGCTFEVTRNGDKAANVGSHFDFEEKLTMDELMAKYSLDTEGVTPFNYEEIIMFKSADELRAAGFGQTAPLGSEDKPMMNAAPPGVELPSSEDMAQQL